METLQRLLLIASPLMRRTPTYDRAAALAKAKGWRCTSSLSTTWKGSPRRAW